MQTALIKKTTNYKFGQQLTKGERVEIMQDNKNGSYMVRKTAAGPKVVEYIVRKTNLDFTKPLFQKVFVVEVKEVHVQSYRVYGAKTPEMAKKIVEDGGGDIDEAAFEYSHTLPSDGWRVTMDMEEVKNCHG